MIKIIMAFFGYVKIPLEAVQLSVEVEHRMQVLVNEFPESRHLADMLEGIKPLTEYLRSCRRLL